MATKAKDKADIATVPVGSPTNGAKASKSKAKKTTKSKAATKASSGTRRSTARQSRKVTNLVVVESPAKARTLR